MVNPVTLISCLSVATRDGQIVARYPFEATADNERSASDKIRDEERAVFEKICEKYGDKIARDGTGDLCIFTSIPTMKAVPFNTMRRVRR